MFKIINEMLDEINKINKRSFEIVGLHNFDTREKEFDDKINIIRAFTDLSFRMKKITKDEYLGIYGAIYLVEKNYEIERIEAEYLRKLEYLHEWGVINEYKNRKWHNNRRY